ncbi:MAG: hypothetical protein CYPHOPRED_004846, partial [Cyphobasidiales sp. Tagirdzhanova-0007]
MQEIFRAATGILTPARASFADPDGALLSADVLARCLKHAPRNPSADIVQETKARVSRIRIDLLLRASELKQIDIAMLEAAQVVLYEHQLPPLMKSININASFSSSRKFRTAIKLQLRDRGRTVGWLYSYVENNLAQDNGSEWLAMYIDVRRGFCTAATDWIMHSTDRSTMNDPLIVGSIDEVSTNRPALQAAIYYLILELLHLRQRLVPADEIHSSLETILSGRGKGLRATHALPFFGHLGYRISIILNPRMVDFDLIRIEHMLRSPVEIAQPICSWLNEYWVGPLIMTARNDQEVVRIHYPMERMGFIDELLCFHHARSLQFRLSESLIEGFEPLILRLSPQWEKDGLPPNLAVLDADSSSHMKQRIAQSLLETRHLSSEADWSSEWLSKIPIAGNDTGIVFPEAIA